MKNKVEFFILLVILLAAAFLRLYKIDGYMTFLGDEGRDALVVKRIIVDHKLTLLGPTASVGGFFLGPFYYYLMVPFLWIFGLNPVGPAVMVALFGIATVFLVYKVGRDFFNFKVGLLAAAFYAVSPLVITYSRSSWNPNLMPFFCLLVIYVLRQAVAKKNLKLLGLVGFLLGLALQLHYLATFLMVIAAVYFLLFGGSKRKDYHSYLWLIGGFLAGWSPFLLFELRHKFPNFRSLYRFILFDKETGFAGKRFWPIIFDVFFRLFERLVANKQKFLSYLLLVITMPVFLVSWFKTRSNQKKFKTLSLLAMWLLLGVGLFGFYQDDIYDYYFGFMFPLPFLLTAFSLVKMAQKRRLIAFLVTCLAGAIIVVNLKGNPFRRSPNHQAKQAKQMAQFILEKAEGKPFNFALITGSNSDHAYRYFMEISGNSPIVIEGTHVDPERKTVTDQLFVVCETLPCHPEGHPLWEIAGFGRAKIENEWQVIVLKVYKLKHWEGEDEKEER